MFEQLSKQGNGEGRQRKEPQISEQMGRMRMRLTKRSEAELTKSYTRRDTLKQMQTQHIGKQGHQRQKKQKTKLQSHASLKKRNTSK